MLITRECDYAVRVIRALNGKERLSVNEICEEEDITAPFAYKILKKLQKAELVNGFRGVHGGYTLRKDVSEITLLKVYQAIDPKLLIIECLEEGYQCSRNADGMCGRTLYKEMSRVQSGLEELLSEKSLEEVFSGVSSGETSS